MRRALALPSSVLPLAATAALIAAGLVACQPALRGDPCTVDDDCAGDLACEDEVCGGKDKEPDEGSEDGACYPNGTCDEGLGCVDDKCIPGGTLGLACLENETCIDSDDVDLACVDDICVEVGKRDAPCRENNACTPDEGEILLCVSSAGQGSFCRLSCENDDDCGDAALCIALNGGTGAACFPAGARDEACPTGNCLEGLGCIDLGDGPVCKAACDPESTENDCNAGEGCQTVTGDPDIDGLCF